MSKLNAVEGFWSEFDFSALDSNDFKEDSVREEIILPILKRLGFRTTGDNRICRSKKVSHPFVTVGSKQQPLINFPDYLLEVRGKPAWVLDAKAPTEEIKTGKNVEQTYFYAIHPEIRVQVYALCNGREFIAFDLNGDRLLYFAVSEIDKHWQDLIAVLSPAAFEKSKVKPRTKATEPEFDYALVAPLGEIKNIKKQSAKRHFGVHGYFTKQAFQIVQNYIQNFTKPGDTVLDPFGGTGVTLVEALMLDRRAIHIDLNPLSVFMVRNLISPVAPAALTDAYNRIKETFVKLHPKNAEDTQAALKTYPFPRNIKMPKGSDVDSVEKLFSDEQLAGLALLKSLIKEEPDEAGKSALLLVFSSSLNKLNLTFHYTKSEGGGDSAVFRYYRYRIAPAPGKVEILATFEGKLKKLINAKAEIAPLITPDKVENARIVRGTATDLDFIEDNSIDYIYTDPPYGAKIPYLDLSVMWNAWLDFPIAEADYEMEAIEGGMQRKTKKNYSDLISASIREMYRVLKFDRWMSFVFQHQDPAYWHLIVDSAERAGFEYAGAVKQNNGQTSFKKRQNPFTVLSGQLIINFRKVRNPKTIMKADLGADVTDLIVQSIEGVIAARQGASVEEINDELIIRGLELGFLDLLSKKYQDITPFLRANFDYSDETKTYQIKKNAKFKAHIPVELRIKYYVTSLMRRLEREGAYPTFDDIALEIIPLLKNGITPEKQTIRSVLTEIADEAADDQWKLKERGQKTLFGLV